MSLSPRLATLVVVGLALFTDGILYFAIVPLLPAYARELGLGQMEVGVLVGSYAWSLVLATVPMARLADRVGRRAPLLWGLVGLFATTLIFAFVESFPLLVLARVLQGLSGTAAWTAGLALLADHFPAAERPRAMAIVFACANAGTLLGPPASGFLAERLGARAPFIVIGVLAALDALARFTLLRDAPRGEAGARIGILALLRDPVMRLFAGAVALGAGLMGLLESTLPLHLDRVLHLSPGAIGSCFGAAAVAHLVTSPPVTAYSHRVGRRRVLAAGLIGAALLLPLPVLVTRIEWLFAAMIGLGIVFSLVLSPSTPALADAVERIEGAGFAAVFGLVNMTYALGMIAGPYLGSAAVALAGIRPAFVAFAAGAAAYLFVVRRAAVAARHAGK